MNEWNNFAAEILGARGISTVLTTRKKKTLDGRNSLQSQQTII